MPSNTSNRPEKKSTFSDRQYVSQAPAEDDIATKDDSRYLPIDVVERDLDRWPWKTEKFQWVQYNLSGKQWVAATLELVIPWEEPKGRITERRLVGGCNFLISGYAPNSHFVATAKSECVKNAASDLGPRFGRGLNEGFPSVPVVLVQPKGKMRPDKNILEQMKKALENNDETQISILSNVYEFKNEENGNETI